MIINKLRKNVESRIYQTERIYILDYVQALIKLCKLFY